MRTLTIGTRGKRLALWQANAVAALLRERHCSVELTIIKTSGDRLQEHPHEPSSGKGVFVKEIEDALLSRAIDLAVHSERRCRRRCLRGCRSRRSCRATTHATRSPADAPVGLPITTALGRLPPKPAIGTSSVRRAAQLTTIAVGARFTPIRGNVDTRLRKLDAGEFDAIVLAVAGMKRLGFGARITAPIPIDRCIPAPGQGIVAIETRADDDELRRVLATITDAGTSSAFEAERALVTALGGGCQLPWAGLRSRTGPTCTAGGRHVGRWRTRAPEQRPRQRGAPGRARAAGRRRPRKSGRHQHPGRSIR